MAPKDQAKVLFLVDYDSCLHFSQNDIKKLRLFQKNIQYTTRKILLMNSNLASQDRFVWAYKVLSQKFHIKDLLISKRRTKFKELSLDKLKEFEQYIDTCFSGELLDLTPESQCNRLLNVTKHIRMAIQDAVADLPWSPPAVLSPLKQRTLTDHQQQASNNYIFLLSFCPSGPSDLRRFFPSVNLAVTKSEVEMSSRYFEGFLPRTLQHTLFETLNIKLMYLDLSPAVLTIMVGLEFWS